MDEGIEVRAPSGLRGLQREATSALLNQRHTTPDITLLAKETKNKPLVDYPSTSSFYANQRAEVQGEKKGLIIRKSHGITNNIIIKRDINFEDLDNR